MILENRKTITLQTAQNFQRQSKPLSALLNAGVLWNSEIAGSNPALAFKSQRKNKFFSCSLAKIQYCGEPPRPRGSVLNLRPPGLEFRVICVWRAVSSHSPHHPQEVLLARCSLHVYKGGLKSHSFHFILYLFQLSSQFISADYPFNLPRFNFRVSMCSWRYFVLFSIHFISFCTFWTLLSNYLSGLSFNLPRFNFRVSMCSWRYFVLFSGLVMMMVASVLDVGFGILLGASVEIFNVSNTQISILTAITHVSSAFPANTKHLHSICTTSAQRPRRWSNVVQMSYKCCVFTGLSGELTVGAMFP